MTDPRFRRFLKCSGLRGWFTGPRLQRIFEAFMASLFAEKCGATFKGKPLK